MNGKYGNTIIHTAIITVLAALLSETILYSFTSMVALKSSIEVKDYQMSDFYSTVAQRSVAPQMSTNVVLVSVDGLDRDGIAAVKGIVDKASPKAVGVDVYFEHSRPWPNDSALVASMSTPNTVLAAVLMPDSSLITSYFCDEESLIDIGLANLEAQTPMDVVRQYRRDYSVGDACCLTFAEALARVGGMLDTIGDKDSEYINYIGHTFRCLTPELLLDSPEECSLAMQDKIVIIGDTGNMKDMHITPVGVMSGLHIQASIVETMVGGHRIRQSPIWLDWILAIVSCATLVLLNIYLSRRSLSISKLLFRLAQLLLLYVYFMVGCKIFAEYNYCINFAPAMSMIAIGLLVYDIYFGLSSLYRKSILKFKNRKS